MHQLPTGEEVRDWTNAYEDKYDDYFRTDLRLGIRINNKKIQPGMGTSIFRILQATGAFSWRGLILKKQKCTRFISRALYLCSSIVSGSEILIRFALI